MYNTRICNLKGEGRKIISLSKKQSMIFCEEVGDGSLMRRLIHFPLLERVIHYQNCKAREVLSATKTRSEVNCSKKKIRRQKGGGCGRHGERNAPQFRGGAKAHGPKLNRVYEYSLNKKMLKQALCSALTFHADRGTLFLIDDKDFNTNKTQEVLKFLSLFPVYPATKNLLLMNNWEETKLEDNLKISNDNFIPSSDTNFAARNIPKALFVGLSKEDQKNTLLSVRNLNSKGINFIPAIGLNVKDVMQSTYIFIFKDAMDAIANKCVYKEIK